MTKDSARQFITNVMSQEYSKAQDNLQSMVNSKIMQRIREAAEDMEQTEFPFAKEDLKKSTPKEELKDQNDTELDIEDLEQQFISAVEELDVEAMRKIMRLVTSEKNVVPDLLKKLKPKIESDPKLSRNFKKIVDLAKEKAA